MKVWVDMLFINLITDRVEKWMLYSLWSCYSLSMVNFQHLSKQIEGTISVLGLC